MAYAFQRPALAASNTSVTTTRAATVYIASAPITGDNMTMTFRYALWVNAGDALFGGAMDVLGNPPAPRGYLHGLTISNNGTDATNDIDVAAGVARDSDNVRTMLLTSSTTKRLDEIFGVGTNGGCLDTGTIANTTYHVFLIASASSATPDVICSTSTTAPTVPSTDWSEVRRIGSILREAGAIVAFTQDGDYFQRSALAFDVNVTNPGTTAVTRTLSVPTGINVLAELELGLEGDTGDTTGSFLVTDLAVNDVLPDNQGPAHLSVQTTTTGFRVNTYAFVRTNTSAQVRTRASPSDGTVVIRIRTRGWIDRRGRDA